MQARTLPKLLSCLPRNGKAAKVQPAHWPADSYYKVTESKLKFRESAAGAGERVSVGGRAWGELYWKG